MKVILTLLKVFIILFILCLWEWKQPDSFQYKSVNSSFKWASRYILVLAKLKEEEGLFWRVQERGQQCEINPKSTRLSLEITKSIFFRKIRKNLNPPLLFIKLPYIQVLQGMHFCDKFTDRFQDLSKESCCHQGEV